MRRFNKTKVITIILELAGFKESLRLQLLSQQFYNEYVPRLLEGIPVDYLRQRMDKVLNT